MMADEKDPSGVETSTHFKFWIFSQAQIAGKRKDLNDAVKQRLKSYAAKSGKKPKPALTLDEERRLHEYFHNQIFAVCDGFKFPFDIIATAQVFWKRFYLNRSAMDHEPTRMMPAMIYLATKTEEANIKSEHLAKLFHCKIAHIIDQEVPVLEGLNFHLKILHPRRPLQRFCNLVAASPIGKSISTKLRKKAMILIKHSYYTDASLLYPPSQIALCSLILVNRKEKLCRESNLLSTCLSTCPPRGANELVTLKKHIEVIVGTLEKGERIHKAFASKESKGKLQKEANALSSKLRKALNPMNDPTSVEYKKQKEARKRKKAQQKAEKAKKRRAEEREKERLIFGGGDDEGGEFVIKSNLKNFKPRPPPPQPPGAN